MPPTQTTAPNMCTARATAVMSGLMGRRKTKVACRPMRDLASGSVKIPRDAAPASAVIGAERRHHLGPLKLFLARARRLKGIGAATDGRDRSLPRQRGRLGWG